jgi:hypothetical protein
MDARRERHVRDGGNPSIPKNPGSQSALSILGSRKRVVMSEQSSGQSISCKSDLPTGQPANHLLYASLDYWPRLLLEYISRDLENRTTRNSWESARSTVPGKFIATLIFIFHDLDTNQSYRIASNKCKVGDQFQRI